MMRIFTALFVLYLVSTSISYGQSNWKFYGEFGYNTIPLKTQRTGLVRWMIYPSIDIGYNLSEKFNLIGSYFYHDISIGSYDASTLDKYSEIPPLTSYEQAIKYMGKRIGLPELRDYIFLGGRLRFIKAGIYRLDGLLEVGHRFGISVIASHITKSSSFPYAFEVHPTGSGSSGFGLKMEIGQQLIFSNTLYLNVSIGNYFFTRWPKLQPWLGTRVGIYL